ncbi:MAG: hypothetical protein KDD55_02125 [Bdellovibrionales bacterium]|nr:hypothetical protein [Bdellovibrionales bacterium]
MDPVELHRSQPVDPLRTRAVSDPFGFELLGRRIDVIENLLERYLSTPLPPIRLSEGSVKVTGIGSSRAHGEYLADLLRRSSHYNASFQEVPYDGNREAFSRSSTVLFSQGLSSNTHGIVQQQILDNNGLLFTAVTPEGLTQGGAADKAHLLGILNSSDVCIVPMPLEDEYQTLIRVVGPWYGYLAAYRVASELLPDQFPVVDVSELKAMFPRAKESAAAVLKALPRTELERGIHLVSYGPVGAMKNIGEKFLEGAFLSRPTLSSILEFDHGPFQFVARRGGQVFLFRSLDEGEHESAQILRTSLEGCGAPALIEIFSQLPEPLRILEYEMVMNHVMLALMEERGSACDQVGFVEGGNYHKAPGNPS